MVEVNKKLMKECLLTDKEHAKEKGFDNVFEWYLACLNAEINILLDSELRTKERLDNLAVVAKVYIEKLAKAIPIIREAERKRIELVMNHRIEALQPNKWSVKVVKDGWQSIKEEK